MDDDSNPSRLTFLHLPLEIRLEIYTLIFDTKRIQAVTIETPRQTLGTKTAGGIASPPPSQQWHDRPRDRTWYGVSRLRTLESHRMNLPQSPPSDGSSDAVRRLAQAQMAAADSITSRGPLAVLLTCSRIHTEALPILYTYTRFEIVSPDSHYHATKTVHKSRIRNLILPHRHLKHLKHLAIPYQYGIAPYYTDFLTATPAPCLARIKTLTVRCCGSPGGATRAHVPQGAGWRCLWAALAGLTSLKELRVEVCGYRVPAGWRKEVLTPMVDAAARNAFPNLRSWVVTVPWMEDAIAAEVAKSLPFDLVAA